jgi:hypothetical protein
MPYEDTNFRSALERRARRSRKSGQPQDEGQAVQRDNGLPYDLRHLGRFYDQTGEEFSVVRPD